MDFIYKEEYWYVSSFINTAFVDGAVKSEEIEVKIKERIENLKKEDIYYKIRDELGDDIIDMTKNVSISCRWVPYLENFPYEDENNQKEYNTLGYFQFDVEYYKEKPSKKENIKSSYIQQIPQIIIAFLRDYSAKEETKGIFFDLESPMYIFVTSDKIKPHEISWTQENIEKYKKIIGYWTEVYSG